MSLYFWINLLSISVPLLVSFHPKLKLYKNWGALFTAILIAMIPFIIWDEYFTQKEYWGFNPEYLSGVYLLSLPIEEWLFFVCIPYACIFTHYSMLTLFSFKLEVSDKAVKNITNYLAMLFVGLLVLNYDKAYTAVDMAFALLVLLLVYFTKRKLLNNFFITFLIMLIPFFVVNGILTGTGIVDEVVWYDNSQNLGYRLGTIPVEDMAYAFSLILLVLFLFEGLKDRFSKA